MQNETTATGALFPDREQVQRRTIWTLAASSVFSRGATSMVFAVAVLVIKDLLGSANEQWAGLSTASTTVGSALAAATLAAYMQRRGRNPGITRGLVVGALGAVLCIVAALGVKEVPEGSERSLNLTMVLVFMVGMLLVGVGSGASNLSRYAAADLAPEHRRSRDISWIVFAGTFGAVLFPLFVGRFNSVAEKLGYAERSGSMSAAVLLFVVSAAVVFVLLRPDPLAVAGGLDESAEPTNHWATFTAAVRVAFSRPMTRLAFIAIVISQAVMVSVMAMTPLHMEEHGHSDGIIGGIISVHTLGMFAFAPLAGWLADRYGRLPTILLGGFTLALATALTALAGEAPHALMFPGLYLLGLGWSFGIVAGSALLTETVDEGDRVAVQGAADLAMNLASGVGALASGFIRGMLGFHVLSLMGVALSAGLMALAWYERRVLPVRG